MIRQPQPRRLPDRVRLLLLTGAAVAVSAALVLAFAPGRQAGAQQGAAEGYADPTQYPAYFRSGPHLEGYTFTELPLDPDSAFYPSSASTKSGGFYSQQQLMDVERCGDAGCHPDIYDMWFESTHHLASMSDPWYQRSFRLVAERSGIRTAQWCGGCHDPALMMTGKMQQEGMIDFDSAAANVGLTCQFCHSVDRIHPAHANGSFRLAPATPLPHQGVDDPLLRAEGNRLLLENTDLIARHKARRRSPFHVMAEFCATCHKQSLITPVNNYKWFRGFDEYDGWQDSGVSGGSARSFYYPEKPMRCQDCHMPEVPSNDAGNDDGTVNSHRFIGSNTALSALFGYEEQLRRTVEFLQDGVVTVDVFAVRSEVPGGGRALVAPAGEYALAAAPGTALELEVVLRTRGVGHLFTGGTTDSNMAWLEVALLDAGGEPVLMSGGMDDGRFVDPAAHSYRGVFLDEAGQVLYRRNGWDRRTPVYVHQLPPGSADTVHYRLVVPEEVVGPLRVRARVIYRKHKQEYHRWVFGAQPAAEQPPGAVALPAVDTRVWSYDDALVPDLPAVTLAQDELVIAVSPGAPGLQVDGAPLEADRVAAEAAGWMRFNDFGIGLLRQGDLRGAIAAFRRVQALRPDYADGFINEARAHLAEGNLAAGEAVLQRALEIEPGSSKASYFVAQAATASGDYEPAAQLLERVAEEFPYDRAVRVDLGRVYYLMGLYERAIPHLLFVLDAIDPEELGAHYNLMLCYRAMGQDDKADIHESRYLRYKEDEDIRQISGPYKRAHPDDNHEAQPIHYHELTPPAGRFSAPDRFPWTEWLEGGRYWQGRKRLPGPPPPWERADRAGAESPAFTDATAAAGIAFRHVNGAFGDKWMPESLGPGLALFDADADGALDVLLVQGTAWPGHEDAVPEALRGATMQLYLNRGDGTFRDATAGSGLEVPMYGFGAAPGDYDGDGRPDLYVTAYGTNRLFHNEGSGRFRDVTASAGVGHPGWGTSSAWLDYDRDGDLDLYVANYVRWSPESDIYCTLDGDAKSYCTPESYEGEPSVLYRNEGNGTFADATRQAGVFVPGGKSLGVTVADFNDDGWPDLAVANDTEPNFLFENRRDGTFEEVGMVSGMAFDSSGRARAGMGIDTADLRNTGVLSLAIGNFSKEMIGLFDRGPGGLYLDVAARAGIGRSSLPFLTFGLFFFDYDLDGWLDLFASNGHIEDQIGEIEASITYAQRPLLYRNLGDGSFAEVGEAIGGPLTRPVVGRGAAYGDLDGDGDLDIVMATNGGPAYVMRNHARGAAGAPHVLRVRLRDSGGNPDAIGAKVRLRAGSHEQLQMVRSGSSYASQSEWVLTFGLGASSTLDALRITWPDGTVEALAGAALAGVVDHEILVGRGQGVVARRPLDR